MAKTLGQPELKAHQSCSAAIGGGLTLPAGAALGETMLVESTLPPLNRANTEFPGDGGMDDSTDLHAATMRVDSDET